jgi:acyl carrier protein
MTEDGTETKTVESTVRRIWTEVLKATPDGPETHFFDFGGHSLSAMRVMSRLRREWDVKFPTRLIFDHPVLSDFTAMVRGIVEPDTALAQ